MFAWHVGRLAIYAAAGVTLVVLAIPVHARWVLPVPDGGNVPPSLPSVQGYLVSVSKKSVSLSLDSREKTESKTIKVSFIPRTEFFTAYGGDYSPDDLRLGQYVWVWYITEDPAKAGNPPRAAVLMLWSKDPSDKPSEEVRWHFHKTRK